VGLYFAVEFAFVHDANPTGLANAAFAITATLAALSFSYARNLDGRPDLQEQAVAGGERLLRGAILMEDSLGKRITRTSFHRTAFDRAKREQQEGVSRGRALTRFARALTATAGRGRSPAIP
jgi:hypothetical protein